jgi:hypothetical protein
MKIAAVSTLFIGSAAAFTAPSAQKASVTQLAARTSEVSQSSENSLLSMRQILANCSFFLS